MTASATQPVASPKRKPGRQYTWETADWIKSFREYGDAGMASKSVGVTLRTARRRREKDSEFSAEWDAIKAEWSEKLRTSAMQRAIYGVPEPQWKPVLEVTDKRNGRIVKRIKYRQIGDPVPKFSSGLTVFMLKAMIPEEFTEVAMRERAFASGEGGLRDRAKTELRNLSQEGRDALRVFLREQRRAETQALADERAAESQEQYRDDPEPLTIEDDS